MPHLLERDEVVKIAVDLGRAEKVWSERFVSGSGDMTFKLPEDGVYQVVFVRIEDEPKIEVAKRPSAVDLIGYGRRFHKLRTTEEWMKELREGEED